MGRFSQLLDPMGQSYAGMLDPDESRNMFALYMALGGLSQLANANAPYGQQRQPAAGLLMQNLQGYQGSLRDLAYGRLAGQQFKRGEAEEKREQEKERREQELGRKIAGAEWLNPDTSNVMQYGGLASQMGLSPQQQSLSRAMGLVSPQAGLETIAGFMPEQPDYPWWAQADAGGDIGMRPGAAQALGAKAEAERAPTIPDVKDFVIGGQTIPHQWDQPTGQWIPVPGAGGPRWQPPESLDRLEAAAAARERGAQGVRAMLPPEPKTALNFMLPDRRVVLSHDGGTTYADPDTGRSTPMPPTAVRLGLESGAAEARGAEGVRQAQQARGQAGLGTAQPTVLDPARASREHGTGTYSRLAAVADAVGGGLDLDTIVGKDGFFPDIQENRQSLRVLKQTAKAALLNSSRGATWEQQKIDELFPDPDKFWANPRTEAKKIGTMRDSLVTERNYNLEVIASGALAPDEMSKFRASNLEIERSLTLMGYSPDGTKLPGGDFELPGLGKTTTLPSGATIRRRR